MFWFTVLSNSKEIKLGDRYQETLPSAGKNSGVVLVPCRPRKCVFFKKWDSLHARLNSHYKARSYKKKKHRNIKAYRKWLYIIIMSRTRFRVNLYSIVAWMSRNSLLKTDAKSEVWVFVYELRGCGFESRCYHSYRKSPEKEII